MRSAISAIVLSAVVLLGTSARAQFSQGQPQLFTIEGILTPDQETANKVGYDPLSIGFQGSNAGTTRWVGVVGAHSLDGDSFQGKELVESLLPKSPNVLVDGPKDVVSKLLGAPNNSRVVMQGMLIPTSRVWMLDSVKLLPTPPGH